MPISILIFLAVFSGLYLFLAGYLFLHELMPRGRRRHFREGDEH